MFSSEITGLSEAGGVQYGRRLCQSRPSYSMFVTTKFGFGTGMGQNKKSTSREFSKFQADMKTMNIITQHGNPAEI